MPYNIEIFGGPRFLEARCGCTVRTSSGPALCALVFCHHLSCSKQDSVSCWRRPNPDKQDPLAKLSRIRSGNPRVGHRLQICIASVHVSWASRLCCWTMTTKPITLWLELKHQGLHSWTLIIWQRLTMIWLTCWKIFPDASHPYCTADELETHRVKL